MDLGKLLESIDEFIYEIALWILLIPRTLLRIVRRPAWVCAYVDAELQKKKSQRFGDYLSPVLFWFVLSVVPYFCVLTSLSSVKGSSVASGAGFRTVLSMNWQNQLLVIIGFVLGPPLWFSRQTVKALKQTVDRESLRRPFYTQCFCFGPAYLILVPAMTVWLRYGESIPPGAIYLLYLSSWSLFFVWLLYAESAVLQVQLAKDRIVALGYAIYFLIFAFYVFMLFEILIISVIYPQHWLDAYSLFHK